MSKRALKKLVEGGIVRGWDDPRLYTLIAIRRRGIPPGALLSFVNELGVTTAKTLIQITRFEQSVRRYLENTVPRLMLVLDPVAVTIEDLEETQELDVPYSPKDPKFGNHKVRLTKTVYIDRSDFREEDIKGYFRLAPGKTVGLLNAPHPIKATSFEKDETGKVTSIKAVFDKESKPKTYIQWVPDGSIKLEVRVHSPLFKSDDPTSVEGGFLNDINPNSEVVYTDALIEEGFNEVRQRAPWPVTAGETSEDSGPETVRFQAMRVAYFVSAYCPGESSPTNVLAGHGLGQHRRQDCAEPYCITEGGFGKELEKCHSVKLSPSPRSMPVLVCHCTPLSPNYNIRAALLRLPLHDADQG
jgi:glutaminyl-tRNA synthetase